MSKEARRYFGTDGVRGAVGTFPITAEFVLKLGWAAGTVLSKGKGGKVLIGKDTRVSGYMFESALEAGLASAGVDIHLLGPMPTPGIAYLTRTQRAHAGVVISASHNHYEDNGIKFFSGKGYKLDDAIEHQIEALIDQPMTTVSSEKLGKAVRFDDAPGRYIEYCKSTVYPGFNFEGLKIVIDCANGATYHIAPDVFRELGAEVVVMGASPDGYNINADCGSTAPLSLQEKVKEERADLGVAFDGDGDRLILVDHHGDIVDGDEILYVITKFKKDLQQFDGGVVGTVMTNMGLEKAFENDGVPFIRTPVGDRYVIESMLERGWQIGGEQSGHVICLEHATTGDGIISALQVISAVCFYEKPLSAVRKGMFKYPQLLVNVKLEKDINVMADAQVQKAIADAEKLLADRGRVLVRKSGTEPLLRIMVEANEEELVQQVANDLADLVKEKCAV